LVIFEIYLPVFLLLMRLDLFDVLFRPFATHDSSSSLFCFLIHAKLLFGQAAFYHTSNASKFT